MSCFPVLNQNHSTHSLQCEPSLSCKVMGSTLINSSFFTFKCMLEVTKVWVQHKEVLFRSTSSPHSKQKEGSTKSCYKPSVPLHRINQGRDNAMGAGRAFVTSFALPVASNPHSWGLNTTNSEYLGELWMQQGSNTKTDEIMKFVSAL